MSEETLVIRMSSEAAEEHEALLDKLEKRLEAHGVAEWAGTIDMAGTDFIVWLDVEVFDAEQDLPDKVRQIEGHVAAVGLGEVAKVEIPEDADDDDDDDDDGDEGWIDLDGDEDS